MQTVDSATSSTLLSWPLITAGESRFGRGDTRCRADFASLLMSCLIESRSAYSMISKLD
jgi:hypothetical protein